jgi:hypothetical protein
MGRPRLDQCETIAIGSDARPGAAMKPAMTPGHALLAALAEMTRLAGALPDGAEVAVSWSDASADLMLALALQDGADLRTVDGVDEVALTRGALVVRAQRSAEETSLTRPHLTLVRP